MKKKIIKLFQSSFIKNVTIVASGTAGAQAISMILSPIITRLYGPEAYGIMGTFSAMLNIIVPIAALTYPIAIVLPSNDNDAKTLIRLSLIISTVISLISLIIVVLFNHNIIKAFSLEEIGNFLYLIPLVVFFAGLIQSFEQWLIRKKQFSIKARVTLYQSIIINGSKAGIGIYYPSASVLIVLTAISNGIKALMIQLSVKKFSFKRNDKNNEDRKSLLKLAKEYFDFPIYRAPQEFINAVTNGLPTLILTAFFGPASAGFYTIGRTVLRMPSQLIGKSVGEVFYPRIAEAANNKENIFILLKKSTIGLIGAGILPFSIVILFGPFLFSFIFGNDWITAGEYARWIALWSFSSFINRPCVHALPVLNAQRFHLVYTVVMLIARIIALAIGYYFLNSDIMAIVLFSLCGTFLNIGLVIITFKLSKKKLGVNYES